ncbi:MAG: MFS transporter [Flavobacteriaceae bacterium]
MKKLFANYLESFHGLSREIWWLALITLINRSGTMVIPFLSLYLTKDLGFSLENVGMIMTFFGLGSLVGTWIGGKLTDLFGYYKIMMASLIGTGLLFISIQFLSSFWLVCSGIFVLMMVADAFRPAAFVAMSAYSKSENKTRSITLIRLAINIGFSAGPAVGGLIIATIGYSGLFWVDGVTCLLAAALLLLLLHPKKTRESDTTINEAPVSVYSDRPYWIFFAAMVLCSFIFVQYFSTVPLYYNEIHSLSENQIGLLLGMNGFLIFVLEMPLIRYLELKGRSKIHNMMLGFLLVTLSFLILNLTEWPGILIIGMILMTFGEMIIFPFSNAWALERAKHGKQGEYMAIYSIAFSFAHIFAHNSGMRSISNFGYEITWFGASFIGLLGILLFLFLKNRLERKSR